MTVARAAAGAVRKNEAPICNWGGSMRKWGGSAGGWSTLP
jgi:hypothetical protein